MHPVTSDKLKLGIVGACGRGASFKAACDALATVTVHAVCDTNAKDLPAARERLGAREQYTDYGEMLEKAGLDAVIIGTPMHFHVPQAVAALERNLHVLSEVTAGVSMEECRQLVVACRKSRGIYMMAENYTYMQPNVIVREMVRRGLFGTPYYGEGEYLHELKGLNEITLWRRRWQTGVNGVTYGTHSLGPILQWMPGDRVVSVCCAGSGHHYRDPRGTAYENEDSCVMLCNMASGGLVKIRVDMLSDRPHAMTNYQLQGTDGCYESARARGEKNRVWLRARCRDANAWMDLDELSDEFLPDFWKEGMERARAAGHGGGDYFEVLDFVDAITGCRPCPIGIDEAMDMTLPGLASQESIAVGRWIAVPDSRTWVDGATPRRQLQMVWPEGRLSSPPEVRLPPDYELRCLRDGDEDAYVALMHSAGFEKWTRTTLSEWQRRVLPGGLYVIEHAPTHQLAATAMATHSPSDQHPYGGQLGWVAADPAHQGKHLGEAVCAAVVRHYLRVGYRRIYLKTDDFRLAAIQTYLRLGFEPFEDDDTMAERWRAIREALRRPKAKGQ